MHRPISLLLAVSACLLAQTDTSSDPLHPKTTIVVTATRSEIDLEKAPASTSLVTGSELRMRNVQLLDQGLTLLEGTFSSRGKGAGDTLAGVGMRGFAGRAGAQSRVLVLLDGEPLNDAYTGAINWQTLPVNEIDRVEVVRGPFSALYGGNAMGGVVNLLSRPVEKRAGEATVQRGSNDSGLYAVRFSDRFRNRLGVTLGYQRLQSGGYPSRTVTATASSGTTGTPVTGAVPLLTTSGARTFGIGDSGNNWWNQHAWRARGEYTFSASTTVFFQYLRQRYGYGYEAYHSWLRNAAGIPVDSGAVLFQDGNVLRRLSITPGTFLDGPGGGESNFYHARLLHSLTTRQRLSFAAGYFDQASNWYATPASTATLSTGGGTISRRPNRSWHGDAQWTWEPRARHAIVAGAEARREESTANEYALANYAIHDSLGNQSYMARGRAFSQAVYAQDRVRLLERLDIIAGGRVDYWRTSDGANNSFSGGMATNYEDRSRASLTGKLTALYRTAVGPVLRASVGSAFRNPTVYDLYRSWRSSTGTTYLSNPALEPEKLRSWETGMRQRLGGRAQVEATYFENHVRGLIYRTADLAADPAGRTLINRNAGASRTRGIEVSTRERIFSWLQFQGAYSFSNPEITENPAVPASVGKRVPNVPRTLTSAALLGSRGRWSGSLTGRYVGRLFNTDTNADTTKGVPGAFDPYFEAGATLGCEVVRRVTLFGGIENLLDRRYYQYYANPGRTFSAGLRFRM